MLHSFIQDLNTSSPSHNYFQGLSCLFRCTTVFRGLYCLLRCVIAFFWAYIVCAGAKKHSFFSANIICSSATHIFQDLHCCTIHRCYTTRLYKSCFDCSATQLSSDPVSFAPVLHSLLQGLHLCSGARHLLQAQHCLLRCYTAFFRACKVQVYSGARQLSPEPALFTLVLHSFSRACIVWSDALQLSSGLTCTECSLIRCYKAFLNASIVS